MTHIADDEIHDERHADIPSTFEERQNLETGVAAQMPLADSIAEFESNLNSARIDFIGNITG